MNCVIASEYLKHVQVQVFQQNFPAFQFIIQLYLNAYSSVPLEERATHVRIFENWFLCLIQINSPIANQFLESMLQNGIVRIDFQDHLVLRTLIITNNIEKLKFFLQTPFTNQVLEHQVRLILGAYHLNKLNDLIHIIHFDFTQIIQNALKQSNNYELNLKLIDILLQCKNMPNVLIGGMNH